MEQLGPAIQFVSKHRFWFVTGLVTLLAVGVWFFASSRLSSQRMAAQYNIQQQIDDLNKIKKTSANLTTPDGSPAEQVLAHPNDTTKQGMNQEIQESLRSMLAAWKMRREAQESILQWPLEVLDSKDFVNMFSQFDPPEKFASIPDTGFSNLLTIYKDSIPRRMPAICDIIGAKWYFTPPAGAAGSTPQSGQASQGAARDGMQITGSSEVDTRTYTVQWNKDNQALWHEKLTRFKDIDGNKKEYPSPYQVLALQQDLWLLEAMFKIIKEINGDETASDFATIKSIYYVVFGREARMDAKRELITPDPRLASRQEETSRPTFNPDDDPRGGMPGAPTRESDEPVGTPFDPKLTEMVELGPFHGRYVDRFFQPIPIKTIHDVLNSNTLPDQYLELIVAKRVPVRIAIRMDERRIADFIAACRNSPFAFEIELVRVNCDVKGEDIKV
ncbi:MAG TPA: hypothetical protein PKD54_07930, partial [Pirellulaceae bacterium]|nr:hypothetical protein [Pirellulaceae bacterium]